jgi:hypothetical protein
MRSISEMTKPVWQSGGGEGGGFEAEFEAG